MSTATPATIPSTNNTNNKRLIAWSVGGLAVMTVGRWVGIALAPTLLSYSPLLWLALSPLPAHVVVAATVTPMIPLIVVTSVRRVAASALIYMLGRAFGDNGVPWVRARYPTWGKMLDRMIRFFEFGGPLAVFVLPLHLISALAGATRMPVWTFIPAVTAGHVMWCYLTYRLGESLSAQIAPITRFMRENMLGATLGFITFAVLYGLLQRRRSRAVTAALPPASGSSSPEV